MGRSIYVRDSTGRYNVYTINGDTVRRLPAGATSLGPVYNRVDYVNNIRFTAFVRTQSQLAAAYLQAAHKLSTLWVNLPSNSADTRRAPNQGMNGPTQGLTGNRMSATDYAAWYQGRHPNGPVRAHTRWEWCHLLAHGMHGADDETNIVAARRNNNSEQLAIENALHLYRQEKAFTMKISAALVDGNDGQYIGNVIKYRIRCVHGGGDLVIYLDCLHAPRPSQIHFQRVFETVAHWANNKLALMSSQIFHNSVSAHDRNLIREAMEE
jgi:hypothetical protein